MKSSLKSACIFAGLALAPFASFAQEASVTLPDTGVNMSGLATAAITSLGAVIGVVVAGTVAFYLVRIALRWIKGIGGSR